MPRRTNGLERLLCTLSGDDYGIIRECSDSTKTTFKWIGVFVTIIFAACFLSIGYAFWNLSRNPVVGLPIGMFFALTVTNIYLLLLYTLSKNILPAKEPGKLALASFGLRVGFVIFIALIVSKPIEVFLFSGSLTQDITEFKAEKIREYSEKTNDHFDAVILSLRNDLEQRQRLNSGNSAEELAQIESKIARALDDRDELLVKMERLVDQSDYFIQKCLFVTTRYPGSWMISLFIVSVFLAPSILKYRLAKDRDYYEHKKSVEVGVVEADFRNFCFNYGRTLAGWTGSHVAFESKFQDPPFNTTRIDETREFLPETDLVAVLTRDAV